MTVYRRRVHAELDPLCDPGRVVTLSIDPIARAVLPHALPSHDKVPIRIHPNGWRFLIVRNGRVHAELAPLRYTGRVVTLSVDAIEASVLTTALPRDNEVPIRVHRDGWSSLIVRRRRVNQGLASLRHTGRAVTLSVDPITRAVLTVALPGDNKVPISINSNGRRSL